LNFAVVGVVGTLALLLLADLEMIVIFPTIKSAVLLIVETVGTLLLTVMAMLVIVVSIVMRRRKRSAVQ
jgi:hypothetical protein